MSAHGILFQDDMVRALLSGQKTVTRRTSDVWAKRQVGDLLWVRECWARGAGLRLHRVLYRADGPEPVEHLDGGRWRPSIHMPRGLSRLTLRVTDLRQEDCAAGTVTHRWVGDGSPGPRVFLHRDATSSAPAGYERAPHVFAPLPWLDDAEARREGVADRAAYLALWEQINGPVYPVWVWRIAFEVVS